VLKSFQAQITSATKAGNIAELTRVGQRMKAVADNFHKFGQVDERFIRAEGRPGFGPGALDGMEGVRGETPLANFMAGQAAYRDTTAGWVATAAQSWTGWSGTTNESPADNFSGTALEGNFGDSASFQPGNIGGPGSGTIRAVDDPRSPSESTLKSFFDYSKDRLTPTVRAPDAMQAEFSFYVISTSVTISKDLDMFLSLGATKGPVSTFSPGWSVTAQYIDGGADMNQFERSSIISGWGGGGNACFGGCRGVQWSPTDRGNVRTDSYGIGTPGVSVNAGHNWQIVDFKRNACQNPGKC
jgi:hypothetical protein